MIQRFINWLFRREFINGGGLCEPYLIRWILLKLPRGRGLYLHHFIGDDWSRDLHDHPKHFTSIGLWGAYDECFIQDGKELSRTYRAPWIRSFPPGHTHRLMSTPYGGAWTLVYVGPQVRDWGFWLHGKWVKWDSYVKMFGMDRKDC